MPAWPVGGSPSWGGNLKCQPRRGKELLFLRTTISVSSCSHSLLSSLLSAPLRRFRSRWPLRTPSTLHARYGLTEYRRDCSPTSQHLCCPFTAHVGRYAHVGHTVQRVTQRAQAAKQKMVRALLVSSSLQPFCPSLPRATPTQLLQPVSAAGGLPHSSSLRCFRQLSQQLGASC